MKLKYALTVSALALMMSAPALAADSGVTVDRNAKGNPVGVTVDTNHDGETATTEIKKALNTADNKMRSGADEVRAFIVGDDVKATKFEPVVVARAKTADGMIGQTVLNQQGESIAKIHDIILDSNGNATKVVVSDAGLMGLGDKVAAFDYGRIASQKENGDVTMRLTEEMIDEAKKFSYDRDDYRDADKQVIAAGNISVDELLDGHVVDASGKKVADIENVVFNGKNAAHVIVGFDKTLGMGGEQAAVNFDSKSLVKNKGEVNMKLSSNQSTAFENFKTSVKN